MSEEIKPCPFCGSNDLWPDYEDRGISDEYGAWINCGGCGLDGPITAWKSGYKDAEREAWELWNKREG